jgi:hypothetical protein
MYKILINSLKQHVFFLLGVFFIGTVGVTYVGEAVELYRCTRNGMIEFRQTACPDGEQAITEVTEQSGGISPIEPGLRLEPTTSEQPDSKQQTKQTTAVDERCWKTRQRLDWVERRLRAGYKPSQYEGLHRKQAEYDDYLKRFCKK